MNETATQTRVLCIVNTTTDLLVRFQTKHQNVSNALEVLQPWTNVRQVRITIQLTVASLKQVDVIAQVGAPRTLAIQGNAVTVTRLREEGLPSINGSTRYAGPWWKRRTIALDRRYVC